MGSLGKDDIIKILSNLKQLFNDNKDALVELDSRMGDGDLGLTMSKAFTAAHDEMVDTEETDMGKILMKAGMIMARAAPSTMGTLMATGFMRGGKAVSGRKEIATADLADFFQAFVAGIMERGKSKPGDKTVVDSLKPAADTLEASKGEAPQKALKEALLSAEKGLESSKDMIAQHGRIAYYKEQSRGYQDPGATAGVILIKGFILEP
ncbi:MAG: dihydroxyacetone kinase subunit L [Deltaproteobacteria bacterium]|uniref:Dihydroxyacetone kinase subunit L n=1 Tax=Candidatus Desulfacyla euxinica TaxID=2841693 RepID=A0A8J6MZU6_9DELT|nr:dihydroxyacetone kinase subunit L [Candidatus Desulfacyla euxinica]